MSVRTRRAIVLAAFVLILLAYGVTSRTSARLGTELPRTLVDRILPLEPGFVTAYLLFFPLLLVVFLALAGRRCFLWHLASVTGIVVVSLAIFLWFPTRMERPSLAATGGLADRILLGVQSVDAEGNCFPSLHASLTVAACCLSVRHGILRPATAWIIGGLILASTMLVGQHLLLDVMGGVLLALAALASESRLGSRRACHHATHS